MPVSLHAKKGAEPAVPPPSEPCILDEIDIFLILLCQLIIVEREAFAEPAYQKPETAEENQELEDTMDTGIGFPSLLLPAGRQVIGTVINPLPVQNHKGHQADAHEKEIPEAHMRQHNAVEQRTGWYRAKNISRGDIIICIKA